MTGKIDLSKRYKTRGGADVGWTTVKQVIKLSDWNKS